MNKHRKVHVESPADPPRRGFLTKSLAVVIAGIAGLVPTASGLWTLWRPSSRGRRGRRGQGGSNGSFIEVTSLAAVPVERFGRFAVVAERIDVWTRHERVPIGAVYLRRVGEQVKAFNVVCPHLGCAVETLADGAFFCPCHESEFDQAGRIVPVTRKGNATVALRGLDELDVQVREGKVFVRFQNFRPGIAEKIAQS